MPRTATNKQTVTELSEISEFAREQAVILKSFFGLTTNVEFAQLSLLKLQEEAGEVAEAYLAYRKLQRADKLQHRRLDDLYARRDGMIHAVNERLAASWEKTSSHGDQLELPIPRPGSSGP